MLYIVWKYYPIILQYKRVVKARDEEWQGKVENCMVLVLLG
jgi:hypothetical protein